MRMGRHEDCGIRGQTGRGRGIPACGEAPLCGCAHARVRPSARPSGRARWGRCSAGLGTSAATARSSSPRLQAVACRCLSPAPSAWTISTSMLLHVSASRSAMRAMRLILSPFTLTLMLVALRHCKAAVCQQNVNDYSLRGLEGRTLSSLAVGVVGTGAIGAAVMQRLSGFGCEILATGHHANPEVAKRAANVSQDELFRASDVISFHVPATPANHQLVSRESLAEMKDGVVLVKYSPPRSPGCLCPCRRHRIGQDRRPCDECLRRGAGNLPLQPFGGHPSEP